MSREAMQQALEALEFEASGWEDVPPITRDAITTLRKALETEQEPVACASICFQEGPSIDGELIAEAIRARGNT